MWLLLIIMLTVVPGIEQVTVLKTFDSYDTCKPERDRIGFEMAEAYPGENDFVIVCKFLHDGPKRRVHLAPANRRRERLDVLKDTLTLDGVERLSETRLRTAD